MVCAVETAFISSAGGQGRNSTPNRRFRVLLTNWERLFESNEERCTLCRDDIERKGLMMDELLGQPVQCDRGPHGIALDPASGEMTNYSYVGISGGDLVFRRDSGGDFNASRPEWAAPRKYEADIEDVVKFSRISDLSGVEEYAYAHGPLFGPRFSSEGISREPIDAWYFAIGVMALALELVVASQSGGWRALQGKKVAFEFEAVLSARDEKRLSTGKAIGCDPSKSCWSVRASSKFACDIPDVYQRFVLGDQYDRGIWTSRKLVDLAEEWAEFEARPIPGWAALDETDQDRWESAYEMLPGVYAGIVFHDSVCDAIGKPGKQTPTSIRQPLDERPELADKLGNKLCRLLYEALVSAHVRNVPYGWISHKFGPVFEDRLRRMWFTVSTYADKMVFGLCDHCGKPYLHNANKTRKYCSDRCRKAAAKARHGS